MLLTQEDFCDEQVLCWNCEEAIHESASQCPYCYVELHKHPLERPTDRQKITQFAGNSSAQERATQAGGIFSYLFSLVFLLLGSSFFFLSVLIAFFARDGEFVLRWPESSWSAFLGLGMAFLAFGTIFLQKLPSAQET